MLKNVEIIGVQSDSGAMRKGLNLGPSAIRNAGVCGKLSELGFALRDKGDIIPAPCAGSRPRLINYEQVANVNKSLFARVKDTLRDGAFPVILGGDHGISAGSILATADHYGEIGVIWIDAHGDFNNEESTLTGYMNGMPLSAACGLGPAEMAPGTRHFIDPKNAALLGVRDIDPPERLRLIDAGVTVLSISEIDRIGLHEALEKAIAAASSGTKGIYVSFDIDAVTPESAPGVGYPAHRGLTVREAFFIAETLYQCGKVLAVDMVEVNPVFDKKNMTAILACELILSLMGKTVF